MAYAAPQLPLEASADINPFTGHQTSDLDQFLALSPPGGLNEVRKQTTEPLFSRQVRKDLPLSSVEKELSSAQQEILRLRQQLVTQQQSSIDPIIHQQPIELDFQRHSAVSGQGYFAKPQDREFAAPSASDQGNYLLNNVERPVSTTIFPDYGSAEHTAQHADGKSTRRHMSTSHAAPPQPHHTAVSHKQKVHTPSFDSFRPRVQHNRLLRTDLGRSSFNRLPRTQDKGIIAGQQDLQSEDRECVESLRMELNRATEEVQNVRRRCWELESRLNNKESNPSATSEAVIDRDERFCEYFDWIFEFIVETYNVFKQQEIELPPKLEHVYNSICNIESQ